MNSFIKEIAAFSELPVDMLFSSYRYVNFGGSAVYVQGHKGFLSFDSQKIVIRTGKSTLTVLGEGLTVKRLSGDDLMVTGSIDTVTTVREAVK